jgi:tetratricopeptide (TPR) repeat protein
MDRVLERRRAVLGETDRDTIQTLVSVGGIKLHDGLETAKDILQLGMRLTESELGEEDILTIVARTNMARYFLERREAEPALAIIQDNLNTCESWLGEKHTRTIQVLDSLSDAHTILGNTDEAVAAKREFCRRTIATHGARNVVSQQANMGLVRRLLSVNRSLDEARSLGEDARKFLATEFGEADESVAEVDFVLAQIDSAEGHSDVASDRMLKAYERVVKRLGPDDTDSQRLMWGLISHHVGQKEFTKARPLMELGVEHYTRKYGENSIRVVEVKEDLAFVLMQLKEYDEAESIFRECIRIAEAQSGHVQDQFALSCRNQLGTCLNLQERYSETIQVVEPVLEYTHWGQADQWQHANAQGILAEALISLEQFDRAETLLVSAQSGFEQQTAHMPAEWRERQLKKMAVRFVNLYERTKQPDKLQRWTAVLAEYEE